MHLFRKDFFPIQLIQEAIVEWIKQKERKYLHPQKCIEPGADTREANWIFFSSFFSHLSQWQPWTMAVIEKRNKVKMQMNMIDAMWIMSAPSLIPQCQCQCYVWTIKITLASLVSSSVCRLIEKKKRDNFYRHQWEMNNEVATAQVNNWRRNGCQTVKKAPGDGNGNGRACVVPLRHSGIQLTMQSSKASHSLTSCPTNHTCWKWLVSVTLQDEIDSIEQQQTKHRLIIVSG